MVRIIVCSVAIQVQQISLSLLLSPIPDNSPSLPVLIHTQILEGISANVQSVTATINKISNHFIKSSITEVDVADKNKVIAHQRKWKTASSIQEWRRAQAKLCKDPDIKPPNHLFALAIFRATILWASCLSPHRLQCDCFLWVWSMFKARPGQSLDESGKSII